MYRRAKLVGGYADTYSIADDVTNISGFFSGALADAFSTTFPNTENPVSIGSTFKQGGTDGLDWQNTQSTGGTPGICWGTGFSDVTDNDCVMCVQNRYVPSLHYSRIKIVKTVGYTPPSTHETEALVGWTIAAHSISGYEMDFGFGINLQPVRWNGALNDFSVTACTVLSGAVFTAANGDDIIVRFKVVAGSPVISVWQNGVGADAHAIMLTTPTVEFTDITAGKIVAGSPGTGFFCRSGTGADMSKYCISSFECGNA